MRTPILLTAAALAAPAAAQDFNNAAEVFPLSATARDARTADLNGDAAPDLVVALAGDGFAVLLGDDNGDFAPPVVYSTGASAADVEIADINGDAVPDIVALSGSTITVHPGLGDGSFDTPIATSIPSSGSKLAIARLDPGPTLDLAVTSFSGGAFTLLGAGDGTFATPTQISSQNFMFFIDADDLDADGDNDLVITVPITSNDARIFYNNGDGTFSPQPSSRSGPTPRTSCSANSTATTPPTSPRP